MADGEEPKDSDLRAKMSPEPQSPLLERFSTDSMKECSPPQAKPEVFSPRGSEKRVRFLEELIQKPPVKQKTMSQESGSSESRGSANASSPKKSRPEGQRSQLCVCQNNEAGPSSPPVPRHQSPDTKNESKPGEKAKAALHEGSIQPVERTARTISNTNTGIKQLYNCNLFHKHKQSVSLWLIEERIDSGLSVLSKESGESHPTHTTSSDKVSARKKGGTGGVLMAV